jgi:V8-like Glu-specific endopeptidase
MYPPQYRTGYYTGTVKLEDADASKDLDVFLFDLNIIPGDSGSVVYGDGGKLVTLITYGVGGKFAGAYKMAFTEAQVRQAEAF